MGLLLDLALKAGPAPARAAVNPEPIPDAAALARRGRLVAMLEAQPAARYAVLTDESAPDAVVVALAIRDRGTVELRIPREKWDGVLFLELLERHGGTTH